MLGDGNRDKVIEEQSEQPVIKGKAKREHFGLTGKQNFCTLITRYLNRDKEWYSVFCINLIRYHGR
jgi:hypothetical protein